MGTITRELDFRETNKVKIRVPYKDVEVDVTIICDDGTFQDSFNLKTRGSDFELRPRRVDSHDSASSIRVRFSVGDAYRADQTRTRRIEITVTYEGSINLLDEGEKYSG